MLTIQYKYLRYNTNPTQYIYSYDANPIQHIITVQIQYNTSTVYKCDYEWVGRNSEAHAIDFSLTTN